MPAVSKKQQKFFGIVRAIQKGEMAPTTPATAKAAADMKKGDVKKFASTKHKGLPEKKKIVEDKQVKKIIKQLRKSVKSHKKQADTLEKKIKTFKESAFTNITVGNKVAQTFQHATGATITVDGALGGKMMVPSQVTLDLGFGEKITVDGPTESEFGLAGYTKPLDSKLQKRIADQSVDEINDKLDASQEASGAETAKVSDIPSETTFPDTMPSEAEMEANYEKFREGNPDLPPFSELTSGIQLPDIPKEGWTYDQYVAMSNAIRAAGASAEEPIAKQIIDYSPTGTKIHLDKFGQRNTPIGLIDARSAITNAVNRALAALDAAWERYNKIPEPSGYGTDPSRDTETEARPVRGGQLDPTQKFGMRDLGSGPAMTDLGVERKPTGLARVLGGAIDQITGNRTDFDKRGGKKFNPVAATADALTGNMTDFDNRGGIPTGTNRLIGATIDQITGNRTDFDRRGGEKFNPIDGAITKIYGAADGAKLINKINPVIQKHKRDFAKANNISFLGIPQEFKNKGYENSVIKDGNPGSFTNPIINPISDRTKKKFIKALDLNNNFTDIATQLINLSGDSFHKATGMKVTHSEIPGKAGDAEYNVVLNDKGGIEIFDNYAFTERGYMNYPGTGIAKKIGGTEFQKDVATMYDKAGPVGALAHTLLGDIPDRQDPPVRFKTVFTKKDLVRYLGDTNYKILINRMKNERKERDNLYKLSGNKINASNLGLKESKLSFNLIQQFKDGLNPDRLKKLKEQTTFPQMQERIRNAKEKRREQQKKSEKLYMDTKKKGVKFYDKKGTGRLKDGKKVYD